MLDSQTLALHNAQHGMACYVPVVQGQAVQHYPWRDLELQVSSRATQTRVSQLAGN
jgi:hypothetical protein